MQRVASPPQGSSRGPALFVWVVLLSVAGVYKNMTYGIIALVFRCHVISGMPRPTAEASQAAWLTPDEVRERMSPAFAIRLLNAIEDHPHGPAVRTHDGKDLLADVKARS